MRLAVALALILSSEMVLVAGLVAALFLDL